MRRRSFVFLPVFGAIAACSGAESETSVDLQSGRYEVAVTNSSPQFGPRNEQKSLCFTPDHARNFASEPLKDILPSMSGCETKPDERKGNAFSGTRQCTASPGDGINIEIAMNWKGRMAADSFQIDADTAGKIGDQSLSARISINGKRSGDC